MKKFLVLLVAVLVSTSNLAPVCFAKDHIKIIDFENHYYTNEFFSYVSNRKELPCLDNKTKGVIFREGQPAISLIIPSLNTPKDNVILQDDLLDLGEQRIKNMDKAGIDVAIVSYAPGIEELPKEESVKLAQMANNAVYELTKNIQTELWDQQFYQYLM